MGWECWDSFMFYVLCLSSSTNSRRLVVTSRAGPAARAVPGFRYLSNTSTMELTQRVYQLNKTYINLT